MPKIFIGVLGICRQECLSPSLPRHPNAGCSTGRKMSGHLKQQPQRIKREIPNQSLLLIPENGPDAFGSWLCGSGCWLTIFSFVMEGHSSFFFLQTTVGCVVCSLLCVSVFIKSWASHFHGTQFWL